VKHSTTKLEKKTLQGGSKVVWDANARAQRHAQWPASPQSAKQTAIMKCISPKASERFHTTHSHVQHSSSHSTADSHRKRIDKNRQLYQQHNVSLIFKQQDTSTNPQSHDDWPLPHKLMITHSHPLHTCICQHESTRVKLRYPHPKLRSKHQSAQHRP
jgi:hypothetical protein